MILPDEISEIEKQLDPAGRAVFALLRKTNEELTQRNKALTEEVETSGLDFRPNKTGDMPYLSSLLCNTLAGGRLRHSHRSGTALGAEILTAVGEAKLKEISEAKKLRNLTAEYLRRGIDDIKENASYVFSKDEKRFKRYPNLFVGGRKKKASGKSHPNGNGTTQNGQAAPSSAPGDRSRQPQRQLDPISL